MHFASTAGKFCYCKIWDKKVGQAVGLLFSMINGDSTNYDMVKVIILAGMGGH
jgi:hypothetical protein